ncbi:Uncharacterised protein [Neisseria meningitidis]|nr:hypothetical protein [Neisseria meningitidis]CKL30621.1 Uncharacterised protein [Neisseria meningitidis]
MPSEHIAFRRHCLFYSGLTKTSTALLYCLRLAALSYTVCGFVALS